MQLKRSLFQVWIYLAFSVLFSAVACEFSGFYVDNGVGQTIMEARISNTETELLRHHILELLDLPFRDDNERLTPTNR